MSSMRVLSMNFVLLNFLILERYGDGVGQRTERVYTIKN